MKQPFFISSDRTITTAVKQAQWSPKRDLLACLTQDCQVHAYRLTSFQRIWALSFESEATSLCWQPDGEHIAVGHGDGSVSIIAAENGETQLQNRNQTASITCLSWTSLVLREERAVTLTHDVVTRYNRLCPPPLEQSDADGSDPLTKGCAPSLRDTDYRVFDMLCSADDSGDITFSAFGHYSLASCSLAKMLKASIGGQTGPAPKSVPQTLAMCDDLSRLLVVYGTSADPHKPGTLGLLVCGLHGIKRQLTAVHAISVMAATLRHLGDRCCKGVDVLGQSLSAVRSTFVKVCASFGGDAGGMSAADIAAQFEGVKGSMQHELLSLLTAGAASPTLELFLSHKPGEHGLKQAARTIDTLFDTAHSTLTTVIQDGLQRVTFVLSELHGLLRSAPACETLGVQAESVAPLQSEAATLLLRVEVLRHMISDVAGLYRSFFVWLSCGRPRDPAAPHSPWTPDRLQAVDCFLSRHFLNDALGAELQGGDQMNGNVFSVRPALAPRNARNVLDLMAAALGTPAAPSAAPFSRAITNLHRSVTDTFAGRQQALSPLIQPLLKIMLSARGKGHVPCSSPSLFLPTLHSPDGSRGSATSETSGSNSSVATCFTFLCAMHHAHADSVGFIRLGHSAGGAVATSVSGCVLAVAGPDEPERTVVDAHCYKNGNLLILTRVDRLDANTAGTSTSKMTGHHQGELVLVPAPFEPSRLVALEGLVQLDCPQVIANKGGVVLLTDIEGVLFRQTPSGLVNAPLAVSVNRGLATVCAMQRIIVYDLEDDDHELSDDADAMASEDHLQGGDNDS